MKSFEVLVKPVITEKSSRLTDKENKVTFIVNKNATKADIKQAVEEVYKVSVVAVNTMIYPGKQKVRYTKAGVLSGKTKSFKKAIVSLSESDTIDFFQNI
ncbi:MAG: 50S ribosomal protein L23 [Bacteroidales bacterium]